MVKKKLSLLLATIMTTSVLTTGFNKEIIAYAETTTTTSTETQNYTDRVYLSDLDYEGTAWDIVMDKHRSGSNLKLRVNGSVVTFNKGIYAHAASDLIYDVEAQINNGFNTFIAYMGVDASQGGKGDVIFKVYVSSDKQQWQNIMTTQSLTSGSNAVKIQQELPAGTKYLRLQADPNGGNGNDHAVYGDAILVGDDYLNVEMPEGMKSLAELDQEIIALDQNSIGSIASTNGHKLYQREFIKRVDFDMLTRIFRDEPQYKESISYLFGDEKALSYFIETGVVDSGDSYLQVLKNFDLIYKEYKDEIKSDDFLLKLAVTTSWAFAQNVYFWAGHYDAQDVVERFEIYKDFITVSGKDWSWSQDQINFFKNQSPAMLKYTINSRQNNDEMKWFADYINTVKNGSMNGYDYVEYKGVASFNQPQYYGQQNFDTWNAKYNLSEYNINTDDSNKVRWYVVMEVDGVCGAIAKTYAALQETFGRPSGVVNQPGHAATIVYDLNGTWQIVNDVSGWTQSRDEMGQMPLTWGMQSWNSDRSASYILLTQDVLDDYASYQMATKLNILADIYKNDQEKREIVLNKALEVQDNNLDSMYNLIQAYKADSTKTSEDYIELARKVTENFKYYPLPMVDLLNQIQPKIEGTDVVLFDLIKTNALKDGTVATDADIKQPNVTKTMANYLLNGSANNVKTFTFSFTGDKANKLVVADKYSDSRFATSYSIDGGNTWIDTTDFPEIDLSDVADKINAENDILIKVLGANDIYKIDISKAAKPHSSTLSGNDLENTLIGKIENLEYRVVGGEWKDFVEGTKFEGNIRIETRYKSHGTYLRSDSDFYTFKEDVVSEEKKYISINDFEVTGVSSYNGSQTKEKAADGMSGTSWHNTYSGETNKWITFKFNEAKTIHSFDIFIDGGNGILKTGKLYTSEDGETWEEAGVVNGQNVRKQTFTLSEPITTQYLKIEAAETYAATADNVNKFFAITEINFYEKVYTEEEKMAMIMAQYVEPTVVYSTEETTDGEVIATVNVTEGTTMEGESSHTFSENGSYTFKYTRPNGTKGELVASVNWIETEQDKIDKIMANYVEPTIQYSTEETTDGEVVATVNVTEGTVMEGESSYTFSENGSYTFKYTKPDGSTGELVANVTWIEKKSPELNDVGSGKGEKDAAPSGDEDLTIQGPVNQGPSISQEDDLSGNDEGNKQIEENKEVESNNQELKDENLGSNTENPEVNEENEGIKDENEVVKDETPKTDKESSGDINKSQEGKEDIEQNNNTSSEVIYKAQEIKDTSIKNNEDINSNSVSTGDNGAVAYVLLAISSMIGLRRTRKNKKN